MRPRTALAIGVILCGLIDATLGVGVIGGLVIAALGVALLLPLP